MTDAEFLLHTEARLEAKLPGVQHLYFSKREFNMLHRLANAFPVKRLVKGKQQRLTKRHTRTLLDRAQNIVAARVAAKLTNDHTAPSAGTTTGRSGSHASAVPGFQSIRRGALAGYTKGLSHSGW